MSQTTLDDLARLLLRATLAILIFFHGWAKIQNGIGGIEAMVAARGLPAFFALGVYVGEVIAPVLLLLGIFTRLGAGLILVNMLVAIALAHTGHLTEFTSGGGWRLELQAMFIVAALSIVLQGGGRYALTRRWN